MSFRLFIAVLVLLPALSANAGTLWLKNGDRISGEPISIAAGKLRWASTSFGNIEVSLLDVAQLAATKAFNLSISQQEYREDCVFSREEAEQLVTCGGSVVAMTAWAGVTAMNLKPIVEEEKWMMAGFAGLTVSRSTGNTEEERLIVDSSAELRKGDHRNTVTFDLAVEETNKVKTKDEKQISYKYDYFIATQWFLTTNAGYQTNQFKDLEERRTLGFGAGYQFYDTKFIKLSANGGLNYIDERFTEEDDRELLAFRWNLNYRWIINPNGLEFFHDHLILQSLEMSDDWEFNSSTGLKLPIAGQFSSVFKLDYDYDNLPAKEDRKLDRVWSVGVRYSW